MFEDGEASRPAGRKVAHDARLPDERRKVWLPRFRNQGIGNRLIEHALDGLTPGPFTAAVNGNINSYRRGMSVLRLDDVIAEVMERTAVCSSERTQRDPVSTSRAPRIRVHSLARARLLSSRASSGTPRGAGRAHT